MQGGTENIEIAKTYYSQALKLNSNNLRALYGLYLVSIIKQNQLKLFCFYGRFLRSVSIKKNMSRFISITVQLLLFRTVCSYPLIDGADDLPEYFKSIFKYFSNLKVSKYLFGTLKYFKNPSKVLSVILKYFFFNRASILRVCILFYNTFSI